MSGILNFVSGLLPRIEKSTVQKEIETAIKELREFTIPMVTEMASQNKLVPFKSEFNNVLFSHIRDQVKFASKNTNDWLSLGQALNNVLTNALAVQTIIETYVQKDTLRDGITARAAHIIRLVSSISFVSNFTLEAADYLLVCEAAKLGDENTTAPKQAEYIKSNVEKYARLLADVSVPVSDFNQLLKDLPDVYLNDDAQSVAAMFTPRQLDPFNKMAGMSNWTGSPVFAIRMAWETFWAERYHAAKDRKSILELRLIHLQNKQANENNPRLEKEIEGLENRIRKYEQKIRKIEESIV